MNVLACVEDTSVDEYCKYSLYLHFPDKGIMLCLTWPTFTLTIVLCEMDKEKEEFFLVPIADEIPDLCFRLFTTESWSAESDLVGLHGLELEALVEEHASRRLREKQAKEGEIVFD